MSHLTKQCILDAIRQTAKENGGVPLGFNRFEKETSIKRYDIFKYWPKISDAQYEAGFKPNTRTSAYDEDSLFEKFVALMQELGRYPTRADLLVKRTSDPEFPSFTAIKRFGNKKDIAAKISEYAKQKGYSDIVELCRKIIISSKEKKDTNNPDINRLLGEVYLFKSGRYYKIGKTNDTVRRGSEIRIQLPERTNLIHSIKTDDPSGIEAYWHKRFETNRMNGEWFDLKAADVKAFKCWRRII